MNIVTTWFTDNYIEVFGAVAGIIYVFLEIRQNIWLWPVGVVTSAVYIWIFFTGKLYADMSLQVYYLVISIIGWYWWIKGTGHRDHGAGHRASAYAKASADKAGQADIMRKGEEENGRQGSAGRRRRSSAKAEGGVGEVTKTELRVTRIDRITTAKLSAAFIFLFAVLWFALSRLTDSPVPGWDSFITSLSVIATWMLARKIYEHWYLWIIVNTTASILFLSRGLYPTVILYIVYCIMSFEGLREWKKSISEK